MPSLNLAVIGNSSVAALIDRAGRIVWHCLPRPDGDPVFSSLLAGDDAERGFCEVALEGLARTEQAYLGNTAALATTLEDDRGNAIRIVDFAPRFRQHGRVYRPMTLIRRIEPIRGLPLVRIRVRPTFDHGRTEPERTIGSNHIRYLGPSLALRLTTDAPISFIATESAFVLSRPETLILGQDESVAESIPHLSRHLLERTMDYWSEWCRYLSIPFEWQQAVIRAAITLKLCCFEDTGAIVAALTTSIPEASGSSRNWDYRYCWLRDAYFSVHALNRLGDTRTMEDFLSYITNIVALEGEDLKPVYGILPETSLEEIEISTLPGYRGMGPVRVGNLAYRQVQNDGFGSVVLATTQIFFDHRLAARGDTGLFERMERLGARAAESALTPDAGIWEFRGRTDVHTHSAAMCWAACDRLAKCAHALEREDRAAHWRQEADRLREEILERAWCPEIGSFASTLGGREIDASLLLLQVVGLVEASDPRFLATLHAIESKLLRGGHLFRYAAPDDFGLPETAFTICTFWYVEALAAVGRRDEAREIFNRLLACRNHVGLLSEDLDAKTGELWGNFPQTYSMVGLISAAIRLSIPWEDAL